MKKASFAHKGEQSKIVVLSVIYLYISFQYTFIFERVASKYGWIILHSLLSFLPARGYRDIYLRLIPILVKFRVVFRAQ